MRLLQPEGQIIPIRSTTSGFPYIFRGALDVSATDITQGMKMAATRSLADLAKEPVPDYISAAYDGKKMQFGPDYIIPKPFDRRVLIWEASAVAKAAVDEGIAKYPEEFDVEKYREELEGRLGLSYSVMRSVMNQVRGTKKRIVFPEGDNEKVIRAAAQLAEQEICMPILLGPIQRIKRMKDSLGLDFECEIYDPRNDASEGSLFGSNVPKSS